MPRIIPIKDMSETVSVIIPAYNAGKYIGEALDSLIMQTYPDWQAVVVNDGSSDDTEKIIKDYCEKDSRIKLVSKENGGVSRARNTGMDHAEGKYICFLDADDFVAPEFIETLVEGFKSDSCGVSACEVTFSGFSPERHDEKNETYTIEQAFYQMCRNGIVYPYVWNKMYLTSVIRSQKLDFDPDIKYGEDSLFLMKYFACVYGDELVYSRKRLYNYRANEESALRKRKKEPFSPSWLDQIKALERASDFAEQKGLDDFAAGINIRLCGVVYPMVLDLFSGDDCKRDEYRQVLERMRAQLPEFLKSDLFNGKTKRRLRVYARSPKLKRLLVKFKLLIFKLLVKSKRDEFYK